MILDSEPPSLIPIQRTSTAHPDLFAPSPPSAPGPLDGLDPAQAAAASADAVAVVVRAGAGTGKTRTLVARIAHLVAERNVPPESIVVATFTNKAAREIRERVASAVGPESASRLRMGTFHSLGARFLRKHHARAGLDRRFSVVDDDGARAEMRECIRLGAFAEGDAVGPLADTAIARIKQWKSWGLTVEEIERADRPRRSVEDERMARLYVAYQHHMASRDLVDFADLVLLPLSMLLGNDDLRFAESETVRHLLVDEAQDANPAQVHLSRCLTESHKNVFAVGDEDQSIFSFQGGYPAAIQQIAGPGASEFDLTVNRRCTDQILAPAVALVNCNRRKVRKTLASGRAGAEPDLVVAGSDREEAVRVAAKVRSLLDAGTNAADIAVLGRSAFVFAQVEEAFLKEGIPFDVVGAGGFVDREEVRDILAYLTLARRPEEVESFQRIANKPAKGLGPAAMKAILGGDGNAPFFERVAEPLALGVSGENLAQVVALSNGLRDLHEAYDRDLETERVLDVVLSPGGLDYEGYLAGRKEDKARKRRRAESVAALRRLAQEETDFVTFLDRVMLAEDDEVGPPGGRVRVSTMHSSKGLEWDHVVCMAMDSGVIPSPRSLESGTAGTPGDVWDGPRGGGIEEERRLAHVAFTRARHTLTICCPNSRAGKGVSPSRFLPEAGLDPYVAIDPFAVRSAIGKNGRARDAAGRKGFSRR